MMMAMITTRTLGHTHKHTHTHRPTAPPQTQNNVAVDSATYQFRWARANLIYTGSIYYAEQSTADTHEHTRTFKRSRYEQNINMSL